MLLLTLLSNRIILRNSSIDIRENTEFDHIAMFPIKILCPKSSTILTLVSDPYSKIPKIAFVDYNEDSQDNNVFWMLKFNNDKDTTFTLHHLAYSSST